MKRLLALLSLLVLTPLASQPAEAATPRSAQAQKCRTIKVKTSKGVRYRKVCEPAGPLKSPIGPNALDEKARSETLQAARAQEARAYAVNGNTFFHRGRKYRIAEVLARPGELATQRLQKLLDEGSLSIVPVASDDSGVTLAVVRVNGRDIAPRLNQP